MSKYLWLVTQNEITAWNTYHSAVVVAASAYEARCVLPTSKSLSGNADWCCPAFVQVKYLGIAEPGLEGMICASRDVGTVQGTITIEVESGMVTAVTGLPENCQYEILDHDAMWRWTPKQAKESE